MFLPFPNASTVVKAMLFIVGYVIWDAAYTMANVPYGTMLNIVTDKTDERASLSVFRSIGGAVGGMVPGMILPMLIWQKVTYDGSTWFLDKIEIPEGAESAFAPENFHTNPVTGEAYQIGDKVLSPLTGGQIEVLLGDRVFFAALIMGVFGFLFFMFMLKNITVRGDEYAQLNSEGEKINLIKSFGAFIKNRPAVGCTIAAMGMFLGMQSAGTANTIMFATHFGQASLSGLVMMVGFLPMFIFMPFATKLVKKFGKKEVASIGSVAGLIGGVILCCFPLCPFNMLHDRSGVLRPGHGLLQLRFLGYDGRCHRLLRVEDRQARGERRLRSALLLP